jgi:hypothetical protein
MLTTAKTNEADQTIKAHYEIPLDLIGGQVVPHMPSTFLKLGKTVHYKSKDGKVEIEFPNGSPYLNTDGSPKTEVYSYEPPIELKVKGNFVGRCSITTPDGVKHGWPDSSSNTAVPNIAVPNTAGANHDVR